MTIWNVFSFILGVFVVLAPGGYIYYLDKKNRKYAYSSSRNLKKLIKIEKLSNKKNNSKIFKMPKIGNEILIDKVHRGRVKKILQYKDDPLLYIYFTDKRVALCKPDEIKILKD